MDRNTWMYKIGRYTPEYMKGLSEFIKCAEDHREKTRETKISCPCKQCRNNVSIADTNMIRRHLIEQGFDKEYTCWNFHGESQVDSHTFVSNTNREENDNSNDHHHDNINEMLRDVERDVAEKDIKKLQQLRIFTTLLELLHEAFPEDNELPVSTYQAKKMMCPMGLEVERIHACPNDCILFRNGYKDLHECPICNESRLRKLYSNPKDAKLMRWHAEERKKDGKMRHVADSPQWKNIDQHFDKFGSEIRNIRFGLSPKQRGNDIDVYLEPLIEDMKKLWDSSVEVYDAYKKEMFTLFAMIYCTISNFPAYGNLSGYGFYAFTLEEDHPYRKKKSLFDGTIERRVMAEPLNGHDALSQVADLNIVFGKKVKAPQKNIWKKKSIFWDLKYWKHLQVRHCLDVMHIKKNVCESLLGLLLNIPGKTKDEVNARKDMVEMGIRDELAPQETNSKKMYLPAACYTMSKVEKTIFCEFLDGVKVPSGYSTNIKKLVSMEDLKLLGMKSHDCHILMTQMIPIAIRGVLPPRVRHTITKLCLFFNMIYSKVIDPEKLDEWQSDIILTLCELEMYFPPSFFDVMVHLVSHIVREIKACGLAFLRDMYPFERLDGKGTIGRKDVTPNKSDLEQAHFTVLKNMTCVDSYIHEHMSYLKQNNSHQGQLWLEAEHTRTFSQWFADKISRIFPNVDPEVAQLGYRPRRVFQYQGYDINGYTFYTKQQDEKSTVQNSGVTLVATITDSSRMTSSKKSYYGVIEEIWELDYNLFVIPIFKCKWVNDRGGVKVDRDGFTCVNLSTDSYTSDPFILANQATQVFFVEDSKDKRWHVVMHGKRNIVGVDDVVDEDDYNQLDELPSFSSGIQSLDEILDDTVYLRSDHQEGHEE
ncbi:uncharacterized protein Tco_0914491 [Tanacetum coccineum]